MLHIYRQITGLKRLRPIVIAQKREEQNRFPFEPVFLVPKPALHFLRRFWFRQLRDAPWQISTSERAAIEQLLAREDAKLLHIYFGHIAVHLLPLIQHWKKPSVVSFHGADVLVDLQKRRYRAATREMLDAVRMVLVRSESLRRGVIELGCPENKVRLHRTGIPLEALPFQARVWPGDGRWKLLQAGRLIEKKGFSTSLRTFARFRKDYPAATFTIAGEGPLLSELEEEARSLGVIDQVRFTGFLSQEELRREFYNAHLFLHPSELGSDGNQEGVPNSMLEAMATGLPVFATHHGGIPEAIEDATSGVLVKERDHNALADALFEWTRHPDSLTTLSRSGAAAVAAKFEQQGQIHALEGYYFEALASYSGDRVQ